MMKDVIIKIDQNSMVYKQETVLGISYENLQGKIIFKFLGTFPKGIAYLEYERDTEKGYLQMNQVGEEYQLEIKSSLLTKEGRIYLQLRVTEDATPEGTPVFKSNKFYLEVKEAINATAEIPDEYPEWIDTANEKIKEMDNLNITTERVEDGVDIILTDKKGVTTRTEVKDGVPGPVGPQGSPGAVKMQVVDTLPETGETDTIYLVKKDNPGEQNLYDEYVYTDTGWEHIGDTSVDLTDYYTKEESDKNLNDTISENMPLFINAPKYADFVGEKTTEIFRKWYNNYKNGKYIPIMLYTYSRTDWKYVYCFLTGIHDDGTSRLYLYFANMKVNSSNEIIPSTISYAPTYIVYSGTPDKSFVAIDANNDNGSLPFKQITNITNSTISNYTLTKTNTTAYTPTKEYHPSTKKYVDDSLKSFVPTPEVYMVVKEDPLSPMTITDESTLETVSNAINQIKNNKGAIILFTFGSITHATYVGIIQPHNLTDTNVVIDLINSTGMYGTYYDIRVKGTTTNNVFTATKLEIMQWNSYVAGVGQVLTKTNTERYTPTADYHPATKKYVDDAISAKGGDKLHDYNIYTITLDDYNLKGTFPTITDTTTLAKFDEILTDIYKKRISANATDDNAFLIVYSSSDTFIFRISTIRDSYCNLYGTYIEEPIDHNGYTRSYQFNITGTLDTTAQTFKTTKVEFNRNSKRVLLTNNTLAYTPTGDYNPATKKYVDDQVGNINTVLATLTTVSEVSK